jgi:hypothetical protein
MAYPTFDQGETIRRLRESLDTVVWASRLVPPAFTHALPEWYPKDAWTVAMNLAHLAIYHDGIANPILESLIEGGDGTTKLRSDNENWFLNDALALASDPLDVLVERLTAGRERHIELASAFGPRDWNRRWSPVFNSGIHGSVPHSPAWVANKTFQHTWEHGNTMLRAALFTPRD